MENNIDGGGNVYHKLDYKIAVNFLTILLTLSCFHPARLGITALFAVLWTKRLQGLLFFFMAFITNLIMAVNWLAPSLCRAFLPFCTLYNSNSSAIQLDVNCALEGRKLGYYYLQTRPLIVRMHVYTHFVVNAFMVFSFLVQP